MIITNNEELLKRPCEDATIDEIGSIIDQLETELANSAKLGRPGIGLAAPQIGILKKVAIVRLGKDYNVNLINCNIEKGFDEDIFRNEGCLSFPGRLEDTKRFQQIIVKDNLKFPKSFVASGLFAVAIQHELDHIGGILLPDRTLIKPKFKCRPNDLCECGSCKKYKRCCGKA